MIDLETTGSEAPAEIIEFGRVDVVVSPLSTSIEPPMARLFRPLRGIPPETMAVHHITEDDFDASTPVCTPEALRQAIWGSSAPDVLVAHNCEFERAFVTSAVTGQFPWICTYKAALRIWPDAPRHSNQVLRYWRGLKVDRSQAMPPHRAGPDALVTAHLLADLLASGATVDQLIQWTTEPRFLSKAPFGKHRGQPWAVVPSDYLQWMVRQADMDRDTVWNAQQELTRRGAA